MEKLYPIEYEAKKAKIRELAAAMIQEAQQHMLKSIDKALGSGAVNIEDWDEKDAPMILPKCIVVAVLEAQSRQYDGGGTSYANGMKKAIKNLKHFI